MISAKAEWSASFDEEQMKTLGYSDKELDEKSYIKVPNMLSGIINAIKAKGFKFNPETEELEKVS